MITKNRFFRKTRKKRFFYLCTHFYFSLPTEKFLRGQGEKYTQAGQGFFYINKVEFLRIIECELGDSCEGHWDGINNHPNCLHYPTSHPPRLVFLQRRSRQ